MMWPPSKNELARLGKNLACKTCLARARDMSLFLHDSCTILHQFLQDLAKKMCKKFQTFLVASLAKSCTISCKICARLCKNHARIMQEKGHIVCTCQASLACKILAQSCMILQVRFCWAILMASIRILTWDFQMKAKQECTHTYLCVPS